VEHKFPYGSNILLLAASSGSMECVLYLQQQFPHLTWPLDSLESVIECDEFKMISYLLKEGVVWTERAITLLAETDQIEWLHYAWDNNFPFPKDIINHLETNNLNVIQWLHQLGFRMNDDIMDSVVYSRNTNAIDWLQTLNYHVTALHMNSVIMIQDLEMVQCLSKYIAFPKDVMSIAINNSNVAMIKYLIQIGHVLPKDAMKIAIDNGVHVSVIKFLHECGITWNESTGIIEFVCKWDKKFYIYKCIKYFGKIHKFTLNDVKWLIATGNYKTLDYVLSKIKNVATTSELYNHALLSIERLMLVKVLYRHFIPWDEVVLFNSVTHANIFTFLLTRGCPWNTNVVKSVIEKGNDKLLQLLIQHGVGIKDVLIAMIGSDNKCLDKV
jgi:hypothetical protein